MNSFAKLWHREDDVDGEVDLLILQLRDRDVASVHETGADEPVCEEPKTPFPYDECGWDYIDDTSGMLLNNTLAEKARSEEIAVIRELGVWEVVNRPHDEVVAYQSSHVLPSSSYFTGFAGGLLIRIFRGRGGDEIFTQVLDRGTTHVRYALDQHHSKQNVLLFPITTSICCKFPQVFYKHLLPVVFLRARSQSEACRQNRPPPRITSRM